MGINNQKFIRNRSRNFTHKNPLSPFSISEISDFNLLSIFKLRFFWNELKILFFVSVFIVGTIDNISSNLLNCPSRYFIALYERLVCLLCQPLSSNSYFISYFEFHSTTILSTKNCPSSSSE
nr:MAG TPA: hypothetical protein [Caudoviricetes sp.]